MKQKANGFLKLKIELVSTGIVRTISVPASMSLVDLNGAIQAVMGWEDEHLWHFQDGRSGPIYEIPQEDDPDALGEIPAFDASKVCLATAFPERGSKLTYEYDYGDSWNHLVTRMADPKAAEIACLESEGPDGLEDFGGQWRLAEFIRAMREDPEDEEWAEARKWCGLGEPAELQAYLDGEGVAAKTRKLRRALKKVKVELPSAKEAKPAKKMSDEEQAETLGLMFGSVVSVGIWEVLSDAMRHGGKCEFYDYDMTISCYLQTMFDGLKVTDGDKTPLHTEPSTLKIHREWVDWYARHGKEWEELREPFDILESYASAAVHLYGAVSQVELYELMMRYDPGMRLSMDQVMRTLEARALWAGIDYRMEGNLLVDRETFSPGRDDSESAVEELRKAQRDYERWYPADRNELFKWAFRVEYERTPEVLGCELVLRTLCKIDDDQMQEAIDTIHDLIAGGIPPEGIYKTLVVTGLLGMISTKPRQKLLDALEAWMATIRIQCLNGHTAEELREAERRKAQEPKVSRNAPCPCGSGKKYKLCCGKSPAKP